MNSRAYRFALLTLAAIFAFSQSARAQEEDAPKVEVGVQFTSLSVTVPGFVGTENPAGFGGRVTYNLTDYFALEAEANYFPTATTSNAFASGGRITQGQFGAKVGKRFNRFGVFAKARPGLVSFGETTKLTEGVFQFPDGTTVPAANVGTERKTHFSMDVGGVLELYPSRRVLVRFDAGDTMIRYGEHNILLPAPLLPGPTAAPIGRAPSEVKHNFQFTAGVAWRFRDGGSNDNTDAASGDSDLERKFEVGLQFTSLSLNVSQQSFGFPFGAFDGGTNTEAGFGARVGYNINEHVAIEAEGNFFPRRSFPNSTTGGYPLQMQFGAKVGRRFDRFGVFAKARPGFLSFSSVSVVTGSETFTFEGQTFTIPVFDNRRRTYFTTDLGGVLEFYPSSRWLTRFDFGDTIVRYGRRDPVGIFFPGPPPTIPAETRHNFQFSAGIGLRF